MGTDRQTEEVSVASAGSLKCHIQKTRAGNIWETDVLSSILTCHV